AGGAGARPGRPSGGGLRRARAGGVLRGVVKESEKGAPFLPAAPTFSRSRALARRAQARSRRRTPSATSSSLMMSGGSRRPTLSPAATLTIFSPRQSSTRPPPRPPARQPTRSPPPPQPALTG